MTLEGLNVGHIRIGKILGEGGMGQVLEGFDEKLKRRVALKAIHPKRLSDSRARARFLREAQTLSQIEHPNICRIYDFLDYEGQDLIVLEFLEGQTLKERLQEGLDPNLRLPIVEQTCAALVAAHSVSVAHRDLKPENIMITPSNTVKVLDFGLARNAPRLPRSIETTVQEVPQGLPKIHPEDFPQDLSETLTELGDILGTPRYMSPEQARGEEITAASDMYSFGLLVQEIYTGRSPFGEGLDLKSLYHKAMWGDTLPVEGVDTVITELIQGLKSIVPRERPTAEMAAAKLKWLRERPRRRLKTVATALIIGSLTVAAVVSGFGLSHAKKSLKLAQEAQAETESINTFLLNMLQSADPGQLGIDIRVVDVLDQAVDRVAVDFPDHPLSRASIRHTLGSTYHALGNLEKGHRELDLSLELRRKELGENHPQTLKTQGKMGRLLSAEGRGEEAESMLRRNLELQQEILGPEHHDTLSTQNALAEALSRRRKFSESAILLRRSLDSMTKVLGTDHVETLEAMRLLGRTLFELGKNEEAEALLRRTLAAHQRINGEDHPRTLEARKTLSGWLYQLGEFGESAELIEASLKSTRRVLGKMHPKTLTLEANYALILIEKGELREAETILRKVLEDQRQVLPEEHESVLLTMRNLSYNLDVQGREAEADALYDERWAIARSKLGDEHRITLQCKSGVAGVNLERGRYEEAERLYREVLESRVRIYGEDHPAPSRSRRDLAKTLRKMGREDEARAYDDASSPR